MQDLKSDYERVKDKYKNVYDYIKAKKTPVLQRLSTDDTVNFGYLKKLLYTDLKQRQRVAHKDVAIKPITAACNKN